jgi:hypothetical protein
VGSTLDPLQHCRPDDREDARPAATEMPQKPRQAQQGGAITGDRKSDRLARRHRLQAPIGRREAEPRLGRADPYDHRSERDRPTVDFGLDEHPILDRELVLDAGSVHHRHPILVGRPSRHAGARDAA